MFKNIKALQGKNGIIIAAILGTIWGLILIGTTIASKITIHKASDVKKRMDAK